MCLCILTSCTREIVEPSSTGEFNKIEDIVTKIENSDSGKIYDELENVIENFQYFSDEDVLKTILDSQCSESTKHLVVELIPKINYGQGLLNQYPFEKLLNDVTVETSIRIALINTLSFEKSNLSLLKDIVLFHSKFEKENSLILKDGRIGRLLVFKECIKNNIKPFVIEHEISEDYYALLDSVTDNIDELCDLCHKAQERFSVKCQNRVKII